MSAADHAPLVIRRVDAIPVALPLKTPMKMSAETITAAQNLLVRIEAADGSVGWGEAASAPTMTGDTLGGLVAAVRDHLAPMLTGKDARDWQALRPALHRALLGNGGAHSAVEMAVLDLIGRASGKRLIDLVARPRRNGVKPMWLLGNKTAEEDVAEAHRKQKEGFDFFKLKIGVKPLAKEIAIAFAVREALPKTPLCADANCGLTLANARSYVEKTRKARLMFVEQPLAYDDVEGLKKLARGTKVPIGVDEGIHSFADIDDEREGRRRRRFAQADQARRHHRGDRGRQALPAARPVGEHRRQDRGVEHLQRRRAAPACAVPKADWGVSLTHFYLAEDIVRRRAARGGWSPCEGG